MASLFGPVDTVAEADFILASASPRRRQLLTDMRTRFLVVPADIDETPMPDECPRAYVLRMARSKAETVYQGNYMEGKTPKLPVLGVDTVVVGSIQDRESAQVVEKIFGKPESEAHALEMLMTLSGTRHRVLTGIALVVDNPVNNASAGEVALPQASIYQESVVESAVTFRVLSEAECRAYWRSGEPEGKAGAYAIQGLGGIFVIRLSGSYSSVVGLPVAETYTLLQTFNIPCGLYEL